MLKSAGGSEASFWSAGAAIHLPPTRRWDCVTIARKCRNSSNSCEISAA